MEIDYIENENSLLQPPAVQRRRIRPVDDAHPFDLDAYILGYSGRTAFDRLVHIISTCPTLAPQALKLAFAQIEVLRDPTLYQTAMNAYDAVADLLEVQVPSTSDLCSVNTVWCEEVAKKNQAEKTKLEVELKTYSNNMIKESIRMGHRDLGDFYRATGDYTQALKHYTKSREFCSTSQHVLDMCLSVLELVIEQRNYAHISSYVFKAEGALDTANATAVANVAAGSNNSSVAAPPKKSAERDQVQSKLDFAMALFHLGQVNYEKAAHFFLKIGSPDSLGDWIGKIVAPGDFAVYGTLCALASMSRSAIKSQLTGNPIFSAYIEQEPYVRDLIQSYLSSDFKSVLELLERYSTRHYLDIHLYSHVYDLTNLIRNVAVVLYFQPFQTIRLDRMSAAFGWTVEEVEKEVVALIQSGQIQGRVDSQNKILKARKVDHRAELFAHAMKTATEIQSTNRKLLLRMRLQQADLVVKPPKSRREQDRTSELLQGD
ncbi:26S proteasome subunit RPN7-domain-containing protein [Suillus paluster]|uniref:26S proteasome subunit RPN7-domain-containing protein n=1 Tax=Suillus paluster TaxID=48578 RepID=UPI001B87C5FB|nr:26S proteasome subunit RPN7-domain-containing protein [Suillus paluster]KAG1730270.1 26S proteasome subunit RPN7-domain-containing protein [Suillus paluster]